jgi:hypothetical protein
LKGPRLLCRGFAIREKEEDMDLASWLHCDDPAQMLRFLESKVRLRGLQSFVVACCRRVWPMLSQRDQETIRVKERPARKRITVFDAVGWATSAAYHVWRANPANAVAAWDAERRDQCALLRCLFGNPFQLLTPRLFPAPVVGLALHISEAFPAVSEQYLILADALEDLGEEQAAAHCRQPIHAKGCQVLNWIIGSKGTAS